MGADQIVNKLVCIIMVVLGAWAMVRSAIGKDYYLRGGLVSRQAGPRVSGWLARPFFFISGIGAWILAYGLCASVDFGKHAMYEVRNGTRPARRTRV
jgi:hypothetical protein